MITRITRAALAAGAILVLGACRGQTSSEPPIVPFRGMHEMPRYDVQEGSPYFEDGRAMRPPVEGTIPREMIVDTGLAEGVAEDGSYLVTIPQPVVEQGGGLDGLIERGHQRFDIYCSPCHAYTGDGNGMVTRRAAEIGQTFQAANLHDDRLRHAPDGQIFATISNGVRTMPAYRAQIPVQDRWAIVAYVRALQISQADTRTAQLGPVGGEDVPGGRDPMEASR